MQHASANNMDIVSLRDAEDGGTETNMQQSMPDAFANKYDDRALSNKQTVRVATNQSNDKVILEDDSKLSGSIKKSSLTGKSVPNSSSGRKIGQNLRQESSQQITEEKIQETFIGEDMDQALEGVDFSPDIGV